MNEYAIMHPITDAELAEVETTETILTLPPLAERGG